MGGEERRLFEFEFEFGLRFEFKLDYELQILIWYQRLRQILSFWCCSEWNEVDVFSWHVGKCFHALVTKTLCD